MVYSLKTNSSTMKTTDLEAKTALPTINILRRIARERNRYAAILKKQKPNHSGISADDLQFLSKFISESAFYIEELERYIGEELIDYWQTREHALRILTDQMIEEHTNTEQ